MYLLKTEQSFVKHIFRRTHLPCNAKTFHTCNREKVLLAFKNCPGSLAGGRSSYQNSTSFYIFRNILKYRYFDHAIHFEKSWKVPWEPKKWLRIAKFIRIVDLPPSTVKTDLQSLINEPNSFSEQRHLWIFLGNFLRLCRLLSVLFDAPIHIKSPDAPGSWMCNK